MPRHGLETRAAIRAPQPPQLALDHAAVGAEIKVTPALHAPPVDAAAELAALRADAPAAAQPDRHDHPLGTEADIDHGRPGQAEHPVESGRDAHVVLLRKPLVLNSQQPAAEDGGASLAFCATSERNLNREAPAQAAKTARGSPPNDEKTRKN